MRGKPARGGWRRLVGISDEIRNRLLRLYNFAPLQWSEKWLNSRESRVLWFFSPAPQKAFLHSTMASTPSIPTVQLNDGKSIPIVSLDRNSGYVYC